MSLYCLNSLIKISMVIRYIFPFQIYKIKGRKMQHVTLYMYVFSYTIVIIHSNVVTEYNAFSIATKKHRVYINIRFEYNSDTGVNFSFNIK